MCGEAHGAIRAGSANAGYVNNAGYKCGTDSARHCCDTRCSRRGNRAGPSGPGTIFPDE